MAYEIGIALALVLVIEGTIYTLFPDGMRRMMAMLSEQPSSAIRMAGLLAAITGVIIVWMLKQ